MTKYDDLIQRLREFGEAADEQTGKQHGDFHREISAAIEALMTERDAWKEDAADRDDIEGALEQSEKSRREWRERAAMAEAERDALLEERAASCQCEHKPELNKVFNECGFHKGIRERAEKAEADLAAARGALRAYGEWEDSGGCPPQWKHAHAIAAARAEGGE